MRFSKHSKTLSSTTTMPMTHRPNRVASIAHLALACLVSLGLGSCTFTRGQVDECATTAECQEAFGVGSICLPSGFCGAATEQERCATRWPVDLDENPDDYPNIILIGAIIDATLSTHLARAQSVELAVRDANEAGGIDGRFFGLVVCTNEETPTIDSLDQDESAVASADFLRTIGVTTVVGPQSSGAVEAVFTTSDPSLLVISPAASSTDLTDLEPAASDESPGRLWRTAAPDTDQAARIVEDIVGRSIASLAIIHSAGPYGEGIGLTVADGLPPAVTVEVFSYDSTGRLSELLAEVGRGDAEEILLVSSRTEEVVGFLRQAADAPRYDGRTFFLTDAAANRDLFTGIMEHPTLFPRLRGSRPVAPDALTLDTFLARYNLTFGEDARDLSFASNAYDAAWVALYGAAWAVLQEDGTLNATTIARGFRKLTSGTSVPIRMSAWDTVLDAFRAGESIDVIGTSGELDFDPLTEEVSGTFGFWGVDATGLITL